MVCHNFMIIRISPMNHFFSEREFEKIVNSNNVSLGPGLADPISRTRKSCFSRRSARSTLLTWPFPLRFQMKQSIIRVDNTSDLLIVFMSELMIYYFFAVYTFLQYLLNGSRVCECKTDTLNICASVPFLCSQQNLDTSNLYLSVVLFIKDMCFLGHCQGLKIDFGLHCAGFLVLGC